MHTLSVELKVPPEVDAGLDSGEYERVGGVVREAGSKSVVAWLRERDAEALGSQAVEASGVAATAMGAAALGLQFAGIGVMLAGFHVLREDLVALTSRCEVVLTRLGAIDRKLAWIQYAKIAGYQAKLAAKLRAAQAAARRGESVLPFDAEIEECALFYEQILRQMIADGGALRDGELLHVLLLNAVLARAAHTRSQWLLEGPDGAREAHSEGMRSLQDLAAALRARLTGAGSAEADLLALSCDERSQLVRTAEVFGLLRRDLDRGLEELGSCVAADIQAPAGYEVLQLLEERDAACLLVVRSG